MIWATIDVEGADDSVVVGLDEATSIRHLSDRQSVLSLENIVCKVREQTFGNSGCAQVDILSIRVRHPHFMAQIDSLPRGQHRDDLELRIF